ncbi:MAG: hypothetical protein AAFR04_14955 [Pseudomonadota bacterium]
MTFAKTTAVAAALFFASVLSAQAQGWDRSVSGVGPNGGTWSKSASGSCAGGVCSSNQRYTGPRGNSFTRSGTSSCAGGVCSGTATYTGPRGRSFTRTLRFRRR